MVAIPHPLTMLPDREQVIPMAYNEFLARVADGAHAEWVDGEAIIFMSPKERHRALSNFLEVLMSMFVHLFDLGIVRDAPYQMRIAPNGPAREPDLLYVKSDHLARVNEDGLAGPADLVVEIISEESFKRDRDDKFYEYEAAQIPEYWLIDPRPRRKRAEFFRLDRHGRYQPVLLDAAGRYYSLVLPGFWLEPEWFWREPLPNPMALLPLLVPQLPRLIFSASQGDESQ